MFGKTNFSVIALNSDNEQAFKDLLVEFNDPAHNLVAIDADLRINGGQAIGLSSYEFPLGDSEDVLDCEISTGVYGCWYTKLEETTLQDSRILQEHLSYMYYYSPFKFLPKEQKEDILDMMSKEPKTLERTTAPMILDFNTGYLWVSSTSKLLLTDIREFLAEKGVETHPVVFDFGTNDWPRQVLNKVAEGELYLDDFAKRAEDVKATGDPKSVEPHEDAQVEKLLKKYFRCAEHDGYRLFLAAPSKLRFTNEVTCVGTPTPWDATEVLNQGGLGVSSARLTVMEAGSEKLEPVMSLDVSDVFHIEPGFILLKGLEPHTLSRSIKETASINKGGNGVRIKDFWCCDYVENQSALARFVILVKDILDIQGDYGVKRAEAEEIKNEVLD